MFINKSLQIETLQRAQTMKPLSWASNRQLLGSLVMKTALLAHANYLEVIYLRSKMFNQMRVTSDKLFESTSAVINTFPAQNKN